MNEIQENDMRQEVNLESLVLDLGSGEESSVLTLSSEAIDEIARRSQEIWSELRTHEETCDAVLLTTDGGRFLVHRVIMAVCSPYFRALFTSRINGREPRREYTIPGVTADMMSPIIDFAYTGVTKVTEENISSLIPTADQFCVTGMLKDCSKFMIERMNAENCIGIRQLARNYFIFVLEQEADKYLIGNFEEVVQRSEEFLELPMEDIISLLNSDWINVRKEENIWEAGIKWIDYKSEERIHYIDSIMRCVRLGLLDKQYFEENVKAHSYLDETTKAQACKDIVAETMEFWNDVDTIAQKKEVVQTPCLATPRIPYDILFTIGGWSGGSPTSIIEAFDTKADRWTMVHEIDPKGPRAYHKLAVIGTDIYVIGGFNGNEYFNSCCRFNAVTKEWKEVAPMQSKRCYVSVACLNNKIYAIGGYNGYHRQNTAERYDFETNQWTFISSMHVQRSDACATTLNDLIYVIGGFSGIEILTNGEYYNPTTDQWTLVPSMRMRRSGLSVIAHHGYIYAIGGFNGETRLLTGEKYNPETNEWSTVPDMLKARSNFAIEVIDDMIFVIGGFNGLATIGHVECYDDHDESWHEATTMTAYRSALAACVIPGLPNVVDYIYRNRRNLLEEKRQKMIQQQIIDAAMERQIELLEEAE